MFSYPTSCRENCGKCRNHENDITNCMISNYDYTIYSGLTFLIIKIYLIAMLVAYVHYSN